jgi:hypothetical protein
MQPLEALTRVGLAAGSVLNTVASSITPFSGGRRHRLSGQWRGR